MRIQVSSACGFCVEYDLSAIINIRDIVTCVSPIPRHSGSRHSHHPHRIRDRKISGYIGRLLAAPLYIATAEVSYDTGPPIPVMSARFPTRKHRHHVPIAPVAVCNGRV